MRIEQSLVIVIRHLFRPAGLLEYACYDVGKKNPEISSGHDDAESCLCKALRRDSRNVSKNILTV